MFVYYVGPPSDFNLFACFFVWTGFVLIPFTVVKATVFATRVLGFDLQEDGRLFRISKVGFHIM